MEKSVFFQLDFPSLVPRPHLAHTRRRGLVSQIPSLVIDYKFVSVNNEFHNITWSGTINVLVLVSTLFKQTLRYDWLLHVSGASPRIWTCDTRPLLFAWARWRLDTRPVFLWCYLPSQQSHIRHNQIGTMCNIGNYNYFQFDLTSFHLKFFPRLHIISKHTCIK